jgi:hypothetical protein
MTPTSPSATPTKPTAAPSTSAPAAYGTCATSLRFLNSGAQQIACTVPAGTWIVQASAGGWLSAGPQVVTTGDKLVITVSANNRSRRAGYIVLRAGHTIVIKITQA